MLSKQTDGDVQMLFEVNNNLKRDSNDISKSDSNDINNKDDVHSSMEMNVNNAVVRKPGKKLINHKNKDSSFQNMHNLDENNELSDRKVNKS